LVGIAEHEGEGHDEELIALIVADMQDPVAPILKAELVGEGLHHTGRMIARLSKIVHRGAAAIDEHLLRIGTVEIDLGHVQLPSNGTGSHEVSALLVSSTAQYESQKGNALKIWNHIQVVMRGNRIISAPRGELLVEEQRGSAATPRRQQVVEGVDHGIERSQHLRAVDALGCDLIAAVAILRSRNRAVRKASPRRFARGFPDDETIGLLFG